MENNLADQFNSDQNYVLNSENNEHVYDDSRNLKHLFNITDIENKQYTNIKELKCRICYTGSDKEKLISPCHCKGSIGVVHSSCLLQWLSTQETNICELCRISYNIIRTPKTFSDWIRCPSNFSNRRKLIKDLITLGILTTLTIVSLIFCGKETKHFYNWSKNTITLISDIFLCIALIFAYLFYFYMTFRSHYFVYRNWIKTHWTVQLLDPYPLETSNLTDIHQQSVKFSENQNIDIESANSFLNPIQGNQFSTITANA